MVAGMILYRSQQISDSEVVRVGDEILVIDRGLLFRDQWKYRQGTVQEIDDKLIKLYQTSSRTVSRGKDNNHPSILSEIDVYPHVVRFAIDKRMEFILLDRSTISSEDLAEYARQSTK
jgi:hypothetical protein